MAQAVGIIANPASGKDIRRLVAHGSVFDTNEKVNIVRRALSAMDALGLPRALIMPDCHQIGGRALSGLKLQSTKVEPLGMAFCNTQDDTTLAAGLMGEAGAACVVVLGGDGTNRAAAKAPGCPALVPVSTGTNNVFPRMVEGTLAGLAAGLVALGAVSPAEVCRAHPRLEVISDGEVADIALIDLVVTDHRFTGAKALWRVEEIRRIFLTRARADAIGFSAVGGFLKPLEPGGGRGMHVELGPGGQSVLAPIGPGMIRRLPVKAWQEFGPGEEFEVRGPAMLALDGEREYPLGQGKAVGIRLNPAGPMVVDMEKTLNLAAERGYFVR